MCLLPFFDELRNPNFRLPNGSPFPRSVFTFTPEELSLASPGMEELLVPAFIRDPEASASASLEPSNAFLNPPTISEVLVSI